MSKNQFKWKDLRPGDLVFFNQSDFRYNFLVLTSPVKLEGKIRVDYDDKLTDWYSLKVYTQKAVFFQSIQKFSRNNADSLIKDVDIVVRNGVRLF